VCQEAGPHANQDDIWRMAQDHGIISSTCIFCELAHALKAAGVPARGVGIGVDTVALLKGLGASGAEAGRPSEFHGVQEGGTFWATVF